MSIAQIVLSAKDDTAAAFAKAKGNLKSVQDTAVRTGASFGSLGAAITAAFAGVSLARALDTLDRLDDLAEKSGIATDQLGALRFAGETAGTTFDELAGGLRKLAVNMADAAGGGKATGAAFESIGVSVKTAEGGLRSSNDVLLELADRFRGYQDGAAKSALATQIFGKAGEQLIPLLNQGSAGIEAQTRLARELGAVYSGDLAKSAADFNDNLKRLNLAAEGGAVVLLEKFLPGLNQMASQFVENAKNASLFTSALTTLKNALAFNLGLDKLGTLQREASATSSEIERVINQVIGLDNVLQREPGNEAAQRRATSLRKKLKELQDQAVKTGDAIKGELAIVDPREANAETQRLLNRSNANKKAAPVSDKTGGAAKDTSLSQFQAIIDKIKERTAADELQLKTGRQLNEIEKFAVDIQTQLGGAKSKLSAAQKEVVRTRLAESQAIAQQLETRNLLRAAADADFKAEQETLDLIAQQTDARLQENRSLQEQLEIFGRSGREIEVLRTRRLELALAVEKGAIAEAMATGAGAAELIGLRDKAALLQKQIDLRKELTAASDAVENDPLAGATRALRAYGAEVSAVGISTERFIGDSLRTLEDGLTDAFTGKGFDAKKLVDSIISEFTRLQVVKPLLDSIFSSTSGGSAVTSLIGTFFGKASGGPVAAGTPYVVGERGRELFVPQQAGSIIPNSELGGGGSAVVTNNISVGAGVTRGEVVQALRSYGEQLKGEILGSLRNGGAFSR